MAASWQGLSGAMAEPKATIEIREATEKDADAVVELWTEAYVTPGAPGRVVGGPQEAELSRLSVDETGHSRLVFCLAL
jgi:hypothetical protein